MGTQSNIVIELLHTHVANLLGVFGKTVGNKKRRFSGDMAFAFTKLTGSSEKF